jgi:hypothetical protein
MAASDSEIGTMLELLARDLASTKAARHLHALPDSVREVREWYESMPDADIASLTQHIVNDTQQGLMDTFIDTTWRARDFSSASPSTAKELGSIGIAR